MGTDVIVNYICSSDPFSSWSNSFWHALLRKYYCYMAHSSCHSMLTVPQIISWSWSWVRKEESHFITLHKNMCYWWGHLVWCLLGLTISVSNRNRIRCYRALATYNIYMQTANCIAFLQKENRQLYFHLN